MVRARCRVVVGLVAGVAVQGRSRELAAHVAPGAAHRLMRARQGKAGRVVIDARGRPPAGGRVAVLAAAREAPLHVVRALRVQVGLNVALAAVGRRRRVEVGLLAAVAAVAVHVRVGADEREARAAVAVGHRALVRPALGRVARLAAQAELTLVGVLVAVGARSAYPREDQRAVAAPAAGLAVGALEGEARSVVLEAGRLDDRRPALRRVALGAFEPSRPRGDWRRLAVGRRAQGREWRSEREHAGEEQERAQLHGFPPEAWQSRQLDASGL